MKRKTQRISAIIFFLSITFFFTSNITHAACGEDTKFDKKITFFDTIGSLVHTRNIQPPTPPNLGVPLNWNSTDKCTGASNTGSIPTTVTFLPTNYSTTTLGHSEVIQGYDYKAWYPGDPGVWSPCGEGTQYPCPGAILNSTASTVAPNSTRHYFPSNYDYKCLGYGCSPSGDGLYGLDPGVDGTGGGVPYLLSPQTDPRLTTTNKGYAWSVDLPALSKIKYSDNRMIQIMFEDRMINHIDKTGYIDIKVDNSVVTGDVFHIPATNCVKIGGNGPRKVVFTRGDSLKTVVFSTASEFRTLVNSVIKDGFKTIEPLKSYQDQFTFYVDLKKIDESKLPIDSTLQFDGMNSYKDPEAGDIVKTQSSCWNEIANDTTAQQIVFHNNMNTYAGYSLPKSRIIFLSTVVGVSPVTSIMGGSFDYPFFAAAVIHEFGHSLGRLADEYFKVKSISAFLGGSYWNMAARSMRDVAKNCTTYPRFDYRLNNINYGSLKVTPCSTMYEPGATAKMDARVFYRPSENSIMTGPDYSEWRFNVIDCGYMIAGIKGEASTKENASKYWATSTPQDVVDGKDRPKCMDMAYSGTVIKDGIPPVNTLTPSIIAPPSASRLQFLADVWDAVAGIFSK